MLWGKLYQTTSWWLRAKERVCDEQVLIDNFEEFCIQAFFSNMYSSRLNTDVGNHQERFMAPVGKAMTQPAWLRGNFRPPILGSMFNPKPSGVWSAVLATCSTQGNKERVVYRRNGPMCPPSPNQGRFANILHHNACSNIKACCKS